MTVFWFADWILKKLCSFYEGNCYEQVAWELLLFLSFKTELISDNFHKQVFLLFLFYVYKN